MLNKRNSGLFLIVLSSLFWSINSPLVKSLDLETFLLVGMRALIAGVALLPFIRVKKIRWNIYTFLMMVIFVIQVSCIITALKFTSAPIAIGMQFTSPIWLYFWERKKGEPVTLKRLWPLLMLLSGIILFMCSADEEVTLIGNLAALATSFTFAAITYFSKRCMGENPVGLASVNNLFAAFIVLAFIVKDPISKIASITAYEWPILIVLGVVQTGAGYACYNLGLRTVSSTTAAMLTPLEMILGTVWVALFLREIPDIVSVIGFVFVIAGILGEVRESSKASTEIGKEKTANEAISDT
jgi:drug/metabolite transporter (DMT)-like permease